MEQDREYISGDLLQDVGDIALRNSTVPDQAPELVSGLAGTGSAVYSADVFTTHTPHTPMIPPQTFPSSPAPSSPRARDAALREMIAAMGGHFRGPATGRNAPQRSLGLSSWKMQGATQLALTNVGPSNAPLARYSRIEAEKLLRFMRQSGSLYRLRLSPAAREELTPSRGFRGARYYKQIQARQAPAPVIRTQKVLLSGQLAVGLHQVMTQERAPKLRKPWPKRPTRQQGQSLGMAPAPDGSGQ